MTRSLHERLAALQKSVTNTNSNASSSPEPSGLLVRETPEQLDVITGEIERGERLVESGIATIGFTLCDDGFGPYWRRELHYDLLTVHGNARFADLLTCELEGVFKALKLDLNGCDPMQLRIYDTETTGLGTGAGTFPFLHSVGQIEQDDFVVYQYFLHDYGQEYAILHALVQRHFADANACVVSFNGKSFDWPLLKSRLVMQRIQIGDQLMQVDLLYPSRRLWKSSLTSVSLGELERSVLGLQRVDDLPGKEAPTRYFAYAESFDEQLVEPVFAHNATDVCSLVTLLVHISDVIGGKREVFSAGAYVALARWYDEWAEHDLAERCFIAAADCADADWKAIWLQSLYYKRRGLWEQAVRVWQMMHERFGWTIQPAVELAKYAEHRIRDYDAAMHWAESALHRACQSARLETRARLQAYNGNGSVFGIGYDDPVVKLLRHRLERISGKREKQALFVQPDGPGGET